MVPCHLQYPDDSGNDNIRTKFFIYDTTLPTLFLFLAVYGYGRLIFPLPAMPTLAAYKE